MNSPSNPETAKETELKATIPKVANRTIPTEQPLKEQLKHLTAENASELLAQIELMDDASERRGLLIDYFRNLGTVDPQRAIEETKNTIGTDRMSFLASALSGWARTDPDSAWDYYMFESKDGTLQNIHPWAIIREIAKNDMQDAVARVNSLKGRSNTYQGLNAILEIAKNQGELQQAYQSVSTLANPQLKDRAIQAIFTIWSHQDPDTALATIQNLPGENGERDKAMTSFINGWAEKDPIAALNYIENNFDDKASRYAAPTLGNKLLRSLSGDEFLDTIASIEDTSVQDKIVSLVLPEILSIDASVALSFVDRIEDDGSRRNQIRSISQQWLRLDPAAATTYIESIEDEKTRATALTSFLDYQNITRTFEDGESTTARYLRLAHSLGDSTARRDALHTFAQHAHVQKLHGDKDAAQEMFKQLETADWLTEDERAEVQEIAARK